MSPVHGTNLTATSLQRGYKFSSKFWRRFNQERQNCQSLISPSEFFDKPTKQCLKKIWSLCVIWITKIMLHEHLKIWKFYIMIPAIALAKKYWVTVISIALQRFRDFGMLDGLIRENMITYETIIMSRSSRTLAWRKKSKKVIIDDEMGKEINTKRV